MARNDRRPLRTRLQTPTKFRRALVYIKRTILCFTIAAIATIIFRTSEKNRFGGLCPMSNLIDELTEDATDLKKKARRNYLAAYTINILAVAASIVASILAACRVDNAVIAAIAA